MADALSAGTPLEPPRHEVGRSTTLLVDASRDDRAIGVDCWYPSLGGGHPLSSYELLPGTAFTASARADAVPAPGPHPLLVFSHGRSGTRSSYAMLCEGLAARGYVVVAPDHPGDTLADWILGTAVDDTTNGTQRVGDLGFVLDEVGRGRCGLAGVTEADDSRVALAGHSYGAFTAFACAGAESDPPVGAVAGLQPFTRTLPPSMFDRITVPSLFVSGARDQTCPPATDTDPAFERLARRGGRRFEVEHAGHQACSDVGLYLELEPQVDGLPDIVVDYLHSLADQVTGTAGDAWRPTVGLHLRILGAWLDDVMGRDSHRAARELDAIAGLPGVTSDRGS